MSQYVARPGYLASVRRTLSLALPYGRLAKLVAGRNPNATRANAARDQRRYVIAAALYEAAIRIDPRSAALRIQCGHMHKEAGDLAAAGRCYEQARRITPDDADLWLQIGHLRKMEGNLQDAAAAYRQAVGLSPDWPDPQRELMQVTAAMAAQGTRTGGGPLPTRPDGLPQHGMVVPLQGGRLSFRLADGRLEELQVDLGAPAAPAPALSPASPSPASMKRPAGAGPTVGSFDGIIGTTALGWAIDPSRPNEPAELEFVVDGEVLATCRADAGPEGLERLRVGDDRHGFRCKLPLSILSQPGIEVHARLRNGGVPLDGSPRGGQVPEYAKRWRNRRHRLSKRSEHRLRARLDRATPGQLLSIVMPVRDTRHDWLRGMLDSIRGQWCNHWELICVDDRSTDPEILPILHEYARRDPRIRVVESHASAQATNAQATNEGIAHATNEGIRAATGDYVAFVGHDDYLEPDAVYKLLRATRTGAELIYSDEVLIDQDIDAIEAVAARPAFSYDFYLSHPYFVHVVCVQRRLALDIGGWDEALAISADVDFVLRIIERARAVAHVPSVLYRWRTHGGSAGHPSKAAVTDAMQGILRAHLQRTGIGATVRPGLDFNQYRIDFPAPPGRTLVVIPTRNRGDLLRKCVEGLTRTVPAGALRIVVIDHQSDDAATLAYLRSLAGTAEVMPYSGPFNYSAMNNAAVARHGEGCDMVLFANNDIEATGPGWFESMRGLASRTDVGAVGATLVYPDSTIQHAGVVVGVNGLADHAHRLQPLMFTRVRRYPGFLQSLVSVRDYSAVTAACMMMRLAVFEEVGGFDELLVVGFNDTDLCLRVGEAGYKVLNDPYAVLFHHESATRAASGQLDHLDDSRQFRRTWRTLLRDGDPFYNPMLDLHGPDHQIGPQERLDSRIGRVRVRPVVLAGTASCGG